MNLAICEDQKEYIENLIKLLSLWAKSKKIKINYHVFGSKS